MWMFVPSCHIRSWWNTSRHWTAFEPRDQRRPSTFWRIHVTRIKGSHYWHARRWLVELSCQKTCSIVCCDIICWMFFFYLKCFLFHSQNLVDKLTPEDLLRDSHRYLHELLSTVEVLPGADALTSAFDSRRIWQSVATSSSLKEVNQKRMNHAEMFSRFKSITTGDDSELKNGKPAPDIFLLSASRDGIDPNNCIVFEDSLYVVFKYVCILSVTIWCQKWCKGCKGSRDDRNRRASRKRTSRYVRTRGESIPYFWIELTFSFLQDYIFDSLNDFKLEDFGFSD